MKKKIYFVNGALGSGKTTIINQLIEDGILGKIFIIENEVASFAVDGMCLHLNPKQVKILSGECICCSDPEQLVNILEEIALDKENNYENIIIESSGVASLTQLLLKIVLEERLENLYEIGGSIFLIDAPGIERTNQIDIDIADIIIVTKNDILKEAEKQNVNNFILNYPNKIIYSKNNESDNNWIKKITEIKSKDFRDVAIKVHDNKYHEDNFVRILMQEDLINFKTDEIYSKMKNVQIDRIKGFYKKNNKIYHLEMTPEQMREEETDRKIDNLGIVIIGRNQLLLEELILKIKNKII